MKETINLVVNLKARFGFFSLSLSCNFTSNYLFIIINLFICTPIEIITINFRQCEEMVLQGQQHHAKENHIGRIQRIKFKKRFTKGFIVSRSLMPMN